MNKMSRIGKVMSEIRDIPKVITTISNWWVYFLNLAGLSKKGTVFKLRNGLKFIIRPHSFDIRMIKEVFIYDPYHRMKIKQRDVVVDIGAHIGTFAIMAGRKTGKKGRVIAYEPVPETFEVLRRNIQINSLKKIVYPYKRCISGKSGKKALFLFKKDNEPLFHSSSLYREQSDAITATTSEALEVECITLKDIFESNGLNKIDVLKIDCEGEEYKIIFDTSKEYFERIDKIGIEYHDYLSDKYNHQDLINYLKELQFGVYHDIPRNSEEGCGIIYACRVDK